MIDFNTTHIELQKASLVEIEKEKSSVRVSTC